jgi:hypothetical protein
MRTRLSIALDKGLYTRLKQELPAKRIRISAFIEQAVRERRGPSRAELDAAYRAAAKESWRTKLSSEWSVTEGWPSECVQNETGAESKGKCGDVLGLPTQARANGVERPQQARRSRCRRVARWVRRRTPP